MRGAVLYGPRDVRIDDRPDPRIVDPTDAVIRLSATCICGSDLWPYGASTPPAAQLPWATVPAASLRKSAALSPPSSRDSSSSARSPPPTTRARTVGGLPDVVRA